MLSAMYLAAGRVPDELLIGGLLPLHGRVAAGQRDVGEVAMVLVQSVEQHRRPVAAQHGNDIAGIQQFQRPLAPAGPDQAHDTIHAGKRVGVSLEVVESL